MITEAIEKEFEKALGKGWDKIYIFVDFHDVVIEADYTPGSTVVNYYPFAKELLQHLSDRRDICLITWTCSHPEQIEGYLSKMGEDGIKFDYINKNPEVTTDKNFGCYEDKPYYNILLDDKCGVFPHELEAILETFKKYSLEENIK